MLGMFYSGLMQKKQPVIIIFGFAGAGKSTVAELVANKLHLRVIHPSSIMRSLLERKKVSLRLTKKGSGFWETARGITLLKKRLKDKRPADMISDQYLLREIDKGNLVMDSWSMPWLSPHGLKVCLRAPLALRAKRVALRSGIDLKEARKNIRMKDSDTRMLFKRIYGFDIARDHNVFTKRINIGSKTADEIADIIIKLSTKERTDSSPTPLKN